MANKIPIFFATNMEYKIILNCAHQCSDTSVVIASKPTANQEASRPSSVCPENTAKARRSSSSTNHTCHGHANIILYSSGQEKDTLAFLSPRLILLIFFNSIAYYMNSTVYQLTPSQTIPNNPVSFPPSSIPIIPCSPCLILQPFTDLISEFRCCMYVSMTVHAW